MVESRVVLRARPGKAAAASRTLMESCWSLSTFHGAAMARLAMHMTIGRRAPAAHHTCSVM